MLKNRVITASLLAPLILAAILFLPPDGFAMVWGVGILIAAWEWAGLSGLGPRGRLGFTGTLLAILLAARIFALYWAPGELPMWFYLAAVFWWLAWGMAFRKIPDRLVKGAYPLWARLTSGGFVLVSGWVLMVWLRLNFSQYQVLYLFMLIWLADITAYFVGKRWGFVKLVEPISPGKTVEGVYGALFSSLLLSIPVGLWVGLQGMTLIDFVFLSLLTVAFSICGDLFESLAKRLCGAKDSSGLLPGHGGLLDRIDSLLSAVAVFYAGSLMIPIFLQFGDALTPDIILQSDGPALEAPVDHHYDGPMEVPPSLEDAPAPEEQGGQKGDSP